MVNPTLSQRLAHQAPAGPLLLAFSGGVDSSVLLRLLLDAGLAHRLSVVHVNHGLQEQSTQWAKHCRAVCAHYNVPCEVVAVQVATTASVETAAREARYRALRAQAAKQGATVITAHHRDDQAETLLLRLLRGAGVAGLAAMPEYQYWHGLTLWRPLLAVPRQDLQAWATQWQLTWLDDPSNADTGPRRNYLRHRVLPVLQARWPAVDRLLARTAGHMAEATLLLEERACEDARALTGEDGIPASLPWKPLADLSGPRRRNLLRWWLLARGCLPPDSAVLAQIEGLLQAPADRQARVEWQQNSLRRYRGQLYLLEQHALTPLTVSLDWQKTSPPLLPGPWQLAPGTGQVLVSKPAGPVQLAPFTGGERLWRHGMHQQVSELWRAAGVPPWQRRQWPLLYQQGQLVCVPGIGVADSINPRACEPWHLVFTSGFAAES